MTLPAQGQGTVLLTGGAGFIGSTLARRLVDEGRHVVALDNLHPQVHPGGRPRRLPDEVELIPFDVTHADSWRAALKLVRPSTIVHLAAETGTGQSLTEASRHASVNVVGTTQMLDALTAVGHVPEHIVLTSSRAVYGEGAWQAGDQVFYPGPRTREQLEAGRWDAAPPAGASGPVVPLPHEAAATMPVPTNIYAATKLTQEHVLQAWTEANGSALSVLRLQNVYGPGQSLTNSYTGVIAFFSRVASAGEPIDVYEDGAIVRDFVYVEDVVTALTAALKAPPSRPRTVDIGGGDVMSILDAARLVAELRGAPEPKISGRFRHGDVRAASASLDAAGRELGYRPEWSLRRGLAELFAWIDEGGVA
ncbi:MAG: NAD-dependent epimerase/dehydratase family protein [Pseudonocardia sp.]